MVTHRLALVTGLFLLCFASRTEAHRLDEYLEQTLIELGPSRMLLHVHLTPGVAVMPDVIPMLDIDHDGKLSDAEQAAYTEKVRRDLSLSLDGTQLPLRGLETRYPTLEEMREGVGTIALIFEAAYSPAAYSGTLRFANQHASDKAAYLVNCLMPRDPSIHIISQTRSPNQGSYSAALTFETARQRESGIRAWMWIVMTLAGALLCWRVSKTFTARRSEKNPRMSETVNS